MHLASRRLLAGSCLLLLPLALAGCGGSGGSSGSSAATTYVASYAGTYEDVTNNTWGTITFTVTAASTTTSTITGTITGSPNSPGSTSEESITGGTVNTSGVISFNPILGPTGSLYTSAAGTLGPAGGKTLYGTLVAPVGGSNDTIYITTAVNPTATLSGVVGNFSGTIVNGSNSMTGIIALNIGALPSGSSAYPVTGCEVSDDNGTPTLSTISGSLTTSNGLSYTVTSTANSGITSVSGTVNLSTGSGSSGPVLTGTLTNTEATPAQLILNAPEIE